MSLQFRFGIAGAALGLVIGLTGSLIAGAPFGILVLRTLIAMVLTGLLGFILHAAIRVLLPELLQEDNSAPPSDLGDGSGHSVNITLPGEGPANDYSVGDDQAEPLRQAARQTRYDEEGGLEDAAEAVDDGDIIEEVSEDRRTRTLSADASTDASFNEAAFYDGVEHLPDIGGFSEQFQAGDGEESASGGTDGGDEPAMSGSSGKSRNKSGPANLDPSLVAQAIRTALKKEDR